MMAVSNKEELTKVQEDVKNFINHVNNGDRVMSVASELIKLHESVIKAHIGLRKALKVRDGYLIPLNEEQSQWCKLIGDNNQFSGVALYEKNAVKRVMLDEKAKKYIIQESQTLVANGSDADVVKKKLLNYIG